MIIWKPDNIMFLLFSFWFLPFSFGLLMENRKWFCLFPSMVEAAGKKTMITFFFVPVVRCTEEYSNNLSSNITHLRRRRWKKAIFQRFNHQFVVICFVFLVFVISGFWWFWERAPTFRSQINLHDDQKSIKFYMNHIFFLLSHTVSLSLTIFSVPSL